VKPKTRRVKLKYWGFLGTPSLNIAKNRDSAEKTPGQRTTGAQEFQSAWFRDKGELQWNTHEEG